MKFPIVLAFVAVVVLAIGAVPLETNADRLAHGLPPLPPVRRGTPVEAAKRGAPSNNPQQCNTGTAQCCNSTGHSGDPILKLLLGLLGIDVSPDVMIGVTCSPFSLLGGRSTCNQQLVCCSNNSFSGVVAVGCSPLSL